MARTAISAIIAAIITSVTFSLLLVLLHFISYHNQNLSVSVYQFSFHELMILYLIYTTPPTLVSGIVSALLVGSNNKYLQSLLLYLMLGIVFGLIYALVLVRGAMADLMMLVSFAATGVIVSIIFFHVHLLVNMLIKAVTLPPD
ncbi:MAG: hypothetical protein K0R75_3262 [Paenibacillaceae bacterium]|jgi:hypothetical protein|nr:hypothetical protein [Paenibacillaceae bacterium]